MRSAGEIKERSRSQLNHAIRRPGMWGGELAIGGLLADLAFVERREAEVQSEGKKLLQRGAWGALGVVGTFEGLQLDGSADIRAASLYAEMAHRLGWLDLDEPADGDSYMAARTEGRQGVEAGRFSTLEELVSHVGPPNLRIGGSRTAVLGYFPTVEMSDPVFVDVASGSVICCRLASRSIPEDFTMAPGVSAPELFESLEARQGAPLPFWARQLGESVAI